MRANGVLRLERKEDVKYQDGNPFCFVVNWIEFRGRPKFANLEHLTLAAC